MKFKYKIKGLLEIQPEVLEEKIITYLMNNSYRITERGSGYIIFIEDEFSDRRVSKSDYYNRIGEGKFIFSYSRDGETNLELIYFTSVSYYIFFVMFLCAFGVYTNSIKMIFVCSIALAIPILHKIIYLNRTIFKEIMEC